MISHFIKDQELLLLPEKAIYWLQTKTLLIADTHFGKVTHFRKAGIAIPGAVARQNLQRLENLIQRFRPDRLIFLGDLFHSEMNIEWLSVKTFIGRHQHLDFTLIQGNHDVFHTLSYTNNRFRFYADPQIEGPFLLSHEPVKSNSHYNLCGHIHPGVRMLGEGRQSIRVPCYYFGEYGGILPAFGEFTGLHLLKPQKRDSIYILAGNEVIKAA